MSREKDTKAMLLLAVVIAAIAAIATAIQKIFF